MDACTSYHARQSLHLSIDPSPRLRLSSESSTPSSSSASPRGSTDTYPTSPSSSSSQFIVLFSVLCYHDFQSDDSSHLSFSKNELLDVVKQEESGWWAAMRSDSDVVGWIPQAFVRPLSTDMTERLRHVREELRVFEYDAEQLYQSAPISKSVPFEPEEKERISPAAHIRARPVERPHPPPYPSTPIPRPPSLTMHKALSAHTKFLSQSDPISVGKGSAQSHPLRRQDLGRATPNPLEHLRHIDIDPSSADRRRLAIIKKLTGSDDAVNYVSAANSPWYMKPKYAEQLKYDTDGQVRAGTVVALVEKLTTDTSKDAIKAANDVLFRCVFLMTFRTFMTADRLFEMLVDTYGKESPEHITESEYAEWKERCCLPTQKTVMEVFGTWLEHNRLLEEEPHIAQRLTNFLTSIPPRNILHGTAKVLLQTIERLTFSSPCIEPPRVPQRRRKKSRDHKGDLLRVDPTDMAEQLCLYDYRLYNAITPQECLENATTRTPEGQVAANLFAFTSTHDKLANWVMYSILANEAMGKRADTIDFWIKVADKMKTFRNYNAMSAIVTALSSVVVTRLLLTWAHVGRKANLDALLKYNDPTGGFAGYRALQQDVKGSCVPFVGMYLTDIVHIQDQFEEEDPSWVSFIKRHRWHEVVTAMLRHQQNPYHMPGSGSTRQFISISLRAMGTKDQAWFWSRSQEVQHSEGAHVDIRRGLEAAGF